MVPNVLITVGDHRAASVPPALTDDMNLRGEEGVSVAHHGSDIEVVLPIFDGDVEGMAASIEIGDDRVPGPIAEAIKHIASVAGLEEFRVQARVVGPGARVGSHAYCRVAGVVGHSDILWACQPGGGVAAV